VSWPHRKGYRALLYRRCVFSSYVGVRIETVAKRSPWQGDSAQLSSPTTNSHHRTKSGSHIPDPPLRLFRPIATYQLIAGWSLSYEFCTWSGPNVLAERLALLLRIWEVLVHTSTRRRLSWCFSSIASGKGWDSTLNQATTSSFHRVCNPLFTKHIFELPTALLNSPQK
jgi:hypothetical protein